MKSTAKNWLTHQLTIVLATCTASLLAGAIFTRWYLLTSLVPAATHATADAHAEPQSPESPSASGKELQFPEKMWAASGIKIQAIQPSVQSRTIRLTGKISLNEDRVAHIYPMVEGAVSSVHVRLGQVVKKDDLLVVIHSREIGQSKLELYQARLLHQLALAKDVRMQQVAEHTTALIGALREGVAINEIDTRFRNRPMGDYRQQLLSAYASYYKSQTDFDRLESLGDRGAVAAKQFVSAEASRNADRATFQACLEQIEQDLKNSLLLSSQAVSESKTRVAVAETSLKILGYDDQPKNLPPTTEQDLSAAVETAINATHTNPAAQGEQISHYPIRAPFDGTVLSKDVALLEHARPDMQLLRIADLATVWVTADIYEEHMPLLSWLDGKTVLVRNEAWPDRSFKAEIFASGEIMDEASRTIALRAIADNSEHLLKPGMFVSVELPPIEKSGVLQLPDTAVQEHEGQKFVFLHDHGDVFVRRNVVTGLTGETGIEIKEGLNAGDKIVMAGGFVLKSRMLADLMGGE